MAGATWWLGASAPDGQFSTPSHKDKDAPSMADKGGGSAPDGPGIDSSGRHYLDDSVEILGVTQQKPDAAGQRTVTVRVRYVLVHYPKGVVSLSFNLKSATKFTRVTDHPVEAGTADIELSAAIVPVTWPKAQPFKLSVSLSAEPHPNQWSLLAAMAQVLKPSDAPAAGN